MRTVAAIEKRQPRLIYLDTAFHRFAGRSEADAQSCASPIGVSALDRGG